MGNRYLIDTHVFLWWIFDDPKLDSFSREIISKPNNKILVKSYNSTVGLMLVSTML